MKRILFICPYFGVMPYEQMQLWLKSCEYNKDMNWLIITDDRTEYKYPQNVSVEYCEFQELKSKIQAKFDFKIHMNSPYKLCDFKPAYGYIFEEYTQGYDFWGHCDMTDCIFGDLSKFFTEEIFSNNDKIGFLGHMTLYRNTFEVNRRFMIRTNSNIELCDILGTAEHMAFDEINDYSINTIYEENKFPFLRVDYMYADLSPMTYGFCKSVYDNDYKQYYEKRIPMIFEWDKGKLYQCIVKDDQIERLELGYVHFQKRKMKKQFDRDCDRFLIIPEGFIEFSEELRPKHIARLSKNKLIYINFFKLKYKALRIRIKQLKKYLLRK